MRIPAFFRLAAFVALAHSSPAWSCSSPASYRSVVVNVAPNQIPEDAVLLKVRIESAFFSAQLEDIQGLRGEILPPQQGFLDVSKFEIVMRLGSMCNKWIENWTSDHDSNLGVLTGFIVGYPRGTDDGFLRIEPLLYQAAAYRDPDPSRSRGRVAEDAVRRIDPKAIWRPFRIDAAAIARNLDETNAQIETYLERTEIK